MSGVVVITRPPSRFWMASVYTEKDCMMIQIFNGRSRGLGQDAQHAVYLQVSVQMRQHLHHFKGVRLGVFLAIALHGATLIHRG
jgi:hypothetical protein